MKNIVIFGAPGSGKGTQSDLMIEKYSAQFKESGQDHIQGAWDRVAVYAIDPSNITAKGRKH